VHTNPIINAFCSLLYYPGLSEHIKKFSTELKSNNNNQNLPIEVPEFLGIIEKKKKFQINTKTNKTFIISTREYSKKILNRWHLYLYLTKNKTLLTYRKNNCQIMIEETIESGKTSIESGKSSEIATSLIHNSKLDESKL
jgi:hypothetical protein